MFTRRAAILCVFALASVVAACSTPPKPSQPVAEKPAAPYSGPRFVAEGARTPEPFAHVLFCSADPAECNRSKSAASVAMTSDRMDQLVEVNDRINAQITPRDDSGADTWTLSPLAGDCEDYVVTKRHELIRMGWPASALRVAIGTIGAGEGHVVLVVRTSEGDLVLDNRSNDVRPWRQADFSWLSIQSSTDPRIWYRV